MPSRFPALAAAASLAAALATPLPAVSVALAQVPQYAIEDFMATTRYGGASFAPDGRTVLVSSDRSGIFNAWAIPVDGSAPRALTGSTGESVFGVSWFPADGRILYTSDRGGNELDHLYVRDPDGTTTDLTPGDSLKASFAGWAADRRSFFVATNERDRRFFDLYEHTLAPGYPRALVFQNDSGYDVAAVSPDKRWIALGKPRTTSDADVWLFDRETQTPRNLTAHAGTVNNRAADFTPDGRALLLVSDAGREFAALERYDLATGRRSVVLAPSWDVDYAVLSRGRRYVVVGVNADGRNALTLLDARTLKPVTLPPLPAGEIDGVAFSADDRRMAFYVSDGRTPRDLFVVDLPRGTPRRLTRSLNPKIDPAHLVEGRVVRFTSYDGVEVPGFLYRPHGADSTAPVPALVMVHGGPGGQARAGYRALTQYLVNHGYAVYDINNRGSSGYGKTFFALDDRRHGEADLGDVVASKGMLAGTGWVDMRRVGIIGGSYGGFMVLAALAFRPDTFAVGVDYFGVANWIRTLESVPPYWESFRQALYAELGDPENPVDRARLERISPLLHASEIRNPLIVLQGANDPRVLKVESDEIVRAVQRQAVPVEYLVFPDEGHGFVKKANELRGNKAVLDFLDRYLKGREAS
ncbi:MAG TPA: S9 family peptidase [Gemmatimonadales bacterium]|nr:S9 family peptidase [Gemmatimonadales bacterium]